MSEREISVGSEPDQTASERVAEPRYERVRRLDAKWVGGRDGDPDSGTETAVRPTLVASRRVVALGLAALVGEAFLGLRLQRSDEADTPISTVEVVLDPAVVRGAVLRLGNDPGGLRALQAERGELQLWRLLILPRPDGDTSWLRVATSIDPRQYQLTKSSQTVELLATLRETGFQFSVLSAHPYGRTRGIWSTPHGTLRYDRAPSDGLLSVRVR